MTSAPHSGAALARRLRLQQLVVFETVARAGTILAASRELAMTQPAVSKAIQELEAQVGGPLFIRGRRGVTMTALGEQFGSHAKVLLGELRHLAESLNAVQGGHTGHVVIGTLITASSTIVPRAIQRLRAAAPGVAMTIRVGSNAALFPELLTRELDIVVGIVPEGLGVAGLHHVPLGQEALSIVVGAADPLAKRRKVKAADLAGRQWILPTRDSAAWPQARAFFERHRQPMPSCPIESISILTNVALLSEVDIVAMMPRSAAQPLAKAGLLAILPIERAQPFGRVGYTICADREPTQATRRFIAALVDASRRDRDG